MTSIKYQTCDVDGFKIFSREAGTVGAPKLLCVMVSRPPATCSAT